MVDTSDEWIMSRVGIKERRILKEDGLGTSFMASIAVQRLLKATHTDPSEVQMLVCHTVTPDMVFTATSNIICDKCGIKKMPGVLTQTQAAAVSCSHSRPFADSSRLASTGRS